jgi:hypothetical protein
MGRSYSLPGEGVYRIEPTLSSLRVAPGYTVTLYEEDGDGFEGANRIQLLPGTHTCLKLYEFDDMTRAIAVQADREWTGRAALRTPTGFYLGFVARGWG